jgi:protein-tyrosine phosphatase
MKRFAQIILALLQLLLQQSALADEPKHTTLIVLLDGLRADALSPRVTPNLERLAHDGVRTEMTPIWPAISRPNHWGIVTGLNARHSGIFHNDMYNPAAGRPFSLQDPNFFHGEPIWATLAKLGRVSGVIGGWTGAQLTDGRGPSFHIPGTYPAGTRDRRSALALELLDQPERGRPDLLALYFPDIDVDQHHHGVGSPKAIESLKRADLLIGELREGLAERRLADRVTLLVIADHGAMNVAPQEIILSDYFHVSSLRAPPMGGGPVFAIWTKPGEEEAIYYKLASAHPHLRVHRAGEFPRELACCHADRSPPLLVLADPGWSMEIVRPDPAKRHRATHGFDSRHPAMKAIFLAAGPAIKSGAQLAPFETINLYSLLAALTAVQPNPNDGSVRPFCGVLVDPPEECAHAAQESGLSPGTERLDGSHVRVLPLASASNYRDLGGYRTTDGRHVRWGRIYRSGAAPLLSDKDLAYVRSLGIESMVDLRSVDERELAPSRFGPGVRYFTQDYSYSALLAAGRDENGHVTHAALYRSWLTLLAPQFRIAFRELRRSSGAVALNCTAGQDRTGVATALILSALGVPRTTIFEDYHLSTTSRRPENEMPQFDPAEYPNNPAAAPSAQTRLAKPRPLYGATGRAHLEEAFDEIEARWGSVDAYLSQELGVGPEEIEQLRVRYLE